MIILGIDPGLATLGYGVIEAVGQKRRLIQYGTLTTYCFAYKEAFPVFFCGESGRVKLYSVEVHKLSSQLAGECYAVTCSDGTVCCVFVDTSYSARSKQAIAA